VTSDIRRDRAELVYIPVDDTIISACVAADKDSIKFGRSMIRCRATTDWTLHVVLLAKETLSPDNRNDEPQMIFFSL